MEITLTFCFLVSLCDRPILSLSRRLSLSLSLILSLLILPRLPSLSLSLARFVVLLRFKC